MKRRNLIAVFASSPVWALVGGLLPTSVVAQRSTSRPYLADQFSYDGFLAYVNQRFFVYGGPVGVANLKIVDVRKASTVWNGQQFNVIFLGGKSEGLAAGTYVVENSESGRFSLFIEPTTQDAKGQYYRAQFNI